MLGRNESTMNFSPKRNLKSDDLLSTVTRPSGRAAHSMALAEDNGDSRFVFVVVASCCCFALSSTLFPSYQLCKADHPRDIFAADNHQNGTIRLYGRQHYWNLDLYHYDEHQEHSGLWHFLAKPVKPQLFIEDGDVRLVARVDDHFPEKRLTSNIYQGLNFTLMDTETQHLAMVTLSDAKNHESTFLFETMSSPNSADAKVDTRNWIWNTDLGTFKDNFTVVQDADNSHVIVSAFRVYINQAQQLFFLVGRGDRITVCSIANFYPLIISDLSMFPHPP